MRIHVGRSICNENVKGLIDVLPKYPECLEIFPTDHHRISARYNMGDVK